MKRHCKDRAEWRLQLGKPMERLSAHYRLDCDYGNAVMTCWEEGGNEPLYLCESHATVLGDAARNSAAVRSITDRSALDNAKPDHVVSSATHLVLNGYGNERRTGVVDEGSNDSSAGMSKQAANQPQRRKPVPAEIAAEKSRNSAAPEASVAFANAKLARVRRDPSLKAFARDLTYGNPTKAMVDEAIWNLAADSQWAVVNRKIADYTLKLEAALSESRAAIGVKDAIDRPLEEATLAIITNQQMSDPEKDAAIQQLGVLEASVKRGLNEQMTPLDAGRVLREIGERARWGAATELSDKLKPAHAALFNSLKASLHAAVPEAQNLHERLTNLAAARSDLENLQTSKESFKDPNPTTA